jgi:tetratricopeptide (TPR) repeat protein
MSGSRRRRVLLSVAVIAVIGGAAVAVVTMVSRRAPTPSSSAAPTLTIPVIDTAEMQPEVRATLARARDRLIQQAGSAEAWGEFGAACEAHRLFDEAEYCYERAMWLGAGDFRWPYLLAGVREGRGDDPDAVVALLERAVALEPDFPPLHFRLGQVRMRQGALEGAVASYERALVLDENLAIAHRGLGQALLMLDRPEAARKSLERAVELGPEDPAVFAALAQVYMRAGDEERAREAAARAQRTRTAMALPDPIRYRVASMGVSSRHCYDRGVALMRAGDFEGALAQLEIVAGVLPNDPEIQYYLGVCHARARRPDRAIEYLERAVEIQPDLHTAHALLGSIHSAHGRRDQALSHIETAARLAPGNERYREMLEGARD